MKGLRNTSASSGVSCDATELVVEVVDVCAASGDGVSEGEDEIETVVAAATACLVPSAA